MNKQVATEEKMNARYKQQVTVTKKKRNFNLEVLTEVLACFAGTN